MRQWLYLSGFEVMDTQHQTIPTVLHGVYRIPFAPDPPKLARNNPFFGEGVNRLFAYDRWNTRMVSIKLYYQAEQRVEVR